METVRRRRCETCEFHQPGPTACTGLCRNLDWQPRGGVRLFVRDRETACYQGWGRDWWQPKRSSGGPGGGASGPNPSRAPGGNSGGPFPPSVNAATIPLVPVELLAADVVLQPPAPPVQSGRPLTND